MDAMEREFTGILQGYKDSQNDQLENEARLKGQIERLNMLMTLKEENINKLNIEMQEMNNHWEKEYNLLKLNLQ